MNNTHKWLVSFGLLAASCQVARKYQQPAVSADGLFREKKEDSTNIGEMPWKSFFADTILQGLIKEGIDNNLDLRIAVQRILSADAMLRKSKAAFLPDLNTNASVKRAKLAFPQGFGLVTSATQFDLGATSSWEADVWGKLGSSKRAALAGVLQSEAAHKAIQTQLVANIALQYYTLMALDEQLAVLVKTAGNRMEDVETMKLLKSSNVVNGAAVVQSEANQYAAEVAIPDVKRQIRETENALCVLMARKPGTIQRSALKDGQPPAEIRTGIPARLLENRPDVKQAEMTYRAAFENTNVARAYFYPSFTITAGTGFSSFTFKDWFSSGALFANIAGGIAQPILSKGENKARLRSAEAEQQQALYAFQKSLLVAGQEVSDALYLCQCAAEKESVRTRQLASLNKSVDFTKELLRYSSSTNYTDVLTSEQNLLSAQIGFINDRLQYWQGVISLYRSLGGGWK